MSYDIPSNMNKEAAEWIRFGMRMGISSALHPLEYSKILMQLGYEPIPPITGRSILLGKPVLLLPNIFQYAGHIRRVDGFYGCYRGLAPKLAGSICSMIVSEKVADRFGFISLDDKKDEALTNEELYMQFKVNLKRDIVLSIAGIIVSQPFHVVSVRMMAQFIGRETIYKTILGSIRDIYRNEGILGLFAGLIPKLLSDIACLILTSSTVYIINKHAVKDRTLRQYSAAFTQFMFSTILYPLNVVSNCMAVTASRLAAGQPPIMPEYKNWLDCFSDLRTRGELKRGSSSFFRTTKPFSLQAMKHNGFYVPMPTLAKYF